MDEKIVIVTDNIRNNPYNELSGVEKFFVVLYKDEKIDFAIFDMKLLIIDMIDIEKIILIANEARKWSVFIPILVISDVLNKLRNIYILRNICGLGLTKVLNLKEFDEKKLLLSTSSLLHPEYPSKTNEIAVILPVYNEETRFNHVYEFIKNLKKVINDGNLYYNIYFINDGSKDRTQELVERLIKDENSNTKYVANKPMFLGYKLNINSRKAGTYIEAMRYIEADIMVFVDADNSFLVDDISKMVNLINEGYYDIIAGTKDLTAEKRPLVRRIMSFFKRILTKNLLPKGVYDSQTGLKALSSNAVKYILPHINQSAGLAVDLELMYVAKRMNFRVLQLPINCIDQEGSHVDIIKDTIHYLKIILRIIIKKRREDYDI